MFQSPIFWIVVGLIVAFVVWRIWRGRRSAAEVRIEQIGNEAFQLALAGQGWQAEQMVQQLVEETAKEHGSRSRLRPSSFLEFKTGRKPNHEKRLHLPA